MLKYVFFFFAILQITSCKPKADQTVTTVRENASVDSTSPDSFFPVTNYIKGQINEIRVKGINPVMYVTKDQKIDSVWLKSEDFEKEMAPFLETVIDSANLKDLFSEKKFLDQTLNAYTFTYDPKVTLPDSIQIQHWDVYVDPDANKVKRIYLTRKTSDKKEQQLTWQSDKWSKIVTIASDKEGQSFVEKEVLIKWDF